MMGDAEKIAHEATGADLEQVTELDAARVQLMAERLAHAQTTLRMLEAERRALMLELRTRYDLQPGDGIDFASRAIVRGMNGASS